MASQAENLGGRCIIVDAFFNEKATPPRLSHGGRHSYISRARILRQFFEKACFQRVFVGDAVYSGGFYIATSSCIFNINTLILVYIILYITTT